MSPPLLIPGFPKKAPLEEPEIINAWELMEDLDDDIPMYSPVKKTTAKPGTRRKSFEGIMESPRKQMAGNKENLYGTRRKSFEGIMESPRKQMAGNKENLYGAATKRPDVDPACVLMKPLGPSNNQQRAAPVAAVRLRPAPVSLKIQASGRDPPFLEPRKSFSPGPLFDPDLLASLEEGHYEEEEQIKKMVSSAPRSRKARDAAAASLLESFEMSCPPGGEDALVLYTTTLRGIRKTFEECNAVRSAIEAYGLQIVERDVSMDSGFREELRKLLTWKKAAARVPLLFVKGRLVGGADEVLRLEDEGKLGTMLAGIPRAAPWCDGCGGIRFVMCMDCRGSRKVFDEAERKAVRCGECNENGLIHCPICC